MFGAIFKTSFNNCSAGLGECLNDVPIRNKFSVQNDNSLNDAPKLPGTLYEADNQCSLVFEQGSKRCPYMVSTYQIRYLYFISCCGSLMVRILDYGS